MTSQGQNVDLFVISAVHNLQWNVATQQLPLVFAGSLVEDVVFAVNAENAVFENALPVNRLGHLVLFIMALELTTCSSHAGPCHTCKA